MDPKNRITPDGYFKCYNCGNLTFIKDDIIKLASYAPNDFYVEEVVDAAVRCTKCNHVQVIPIDMNSVSFTKLLK